MSHLVIATAGHVDHGKTELTKALTGIDTDRLKEEKQRGLSIDLGFAYFTLPSGRCAEIIDVPGHEKFIKNMLAGVGSIDLVLMVIDAHEGVMPQTREHLDILGFQGVKQGIIVLTKCDLVDEGWGSLVREDIREAFRGTFLEQARIIETSALTGQGMEELKEGIDELLPQIPERNLELPARIPIDRVFKIAGFGSVITGTLISGKVRVEDRMELLPQGLEVRIRQLECHGESLKEAMAGQRVGANIVGVRTDQIFRGDVLTSPGYLSPTNLIDGRLKLLSQASRSLKNRERVRLYLGTGEYLARLLLLDCDELPPGGEGLVQFYLEKPVACIRADRFVIRRYSPMITVGGGEVINPHPRRHKRLRPEVIEELKLYARGDPERLLEEILLREPTGVIGIEELTKNLGISNQQGQKLRDELLKDKLVLWIQPGRTLMHAHRYEALKEKLIGTLREFHRQEPLRLYISKEEIHSRMRPLEITGLERILADLQQEGIIYARSPQISGGLGGGFRLSDYQIRYNATQKELKDRIEEIYRRAQFTPPDIAQLAQTLKQDPVIIEKIATSMLETGELIKLPEGIFIHREAISTAEQILLRSLECAGSITVSEFRTSLRSTRKYVLPIMKHFDDCKITRRQGEKRFLYKTPLPHPPP